MRIYVVYDFWKEMDDGVMMDRAARELECQELPGQGGVEFLPSIIPIARQLMRENSFSKVVILNVIPLPMVGMAEQPKIITPPPGLFKPG